MTTWLYVIISVVAISLLSLVGVFTLSIKNNKLEKFLIYFISLSAGTLLGDAFIHLIPEAYKNSDDQISVGISILAGIMAFFILEKAIHWRHCHEVACENHPHPFSYMILVGDALHNLIDGMIIAGSFLISIPLGIATTIAVALHEIPQEIGDFGSLVYGGFSRIKALLLNLLSAFPAVLGAMLVLLFGEMDGLVNNLVPFAAGGFVYIASTDLIPELKKHESVKKSFIQISMFLLGIGIMLALLYLE